MPTVYIVYNLECNTLKITKTSTIIVPFKKPHTYKNTYYLWNLSYSSFLDIVVVLVYWLNFDRHSDRRLPRTIVFEANNYFKNKQIILENKVRINSTEKIWKTNQSVRIACWRLMVRGRRSGRWRRCGLRHINAVVAMWFIVALLLLQLLRFNVFFESFSLFFFLHLLENN